MYLYLYSNDDLRTVLSAFVLLNVFNNKQKRIYTRRLVGGKPLSEQTMEYC